jgi:2'-5' RNA ligase
VSVPRILRTFVAFAVSDDVREALWDEARRLGESVRGLKPIRAENVHLTLHFIGPTPEEDVPAIASALERASHGFPPLAVRYEGLGAFPSASRPRVVWAGVVETEGASRLPALASAVQEALRPLGHGGEERDYHPHVTLARAGSARLRALDRALAGRPGDLRAFGAQVLSDLRLMVSEPGPQGSRYRPLATVPLTAPP